MEIQEVEDRETLKTSTLAISTTQSLAKCSHFQARLTDSDFRSSKRLHADSVTQHTGKFRSFPAPLRPLSKTDATTLVKHDILAVLDHGA